MRAHFVLPLAAVAGTIAGRADARGSRKPKLDPAAAAAAAEYAKLHPKAWPQPAAGPTLTGDPELIFTFDDGPNPATTPAVLDALAAHHIHAIFFEVGVRMDHPQAQAIVDRILADGHIIANHSWTHQDLCRKAVDDQRANDEIDKGKQLIEARTHMELVWFRTPYGARCERVDNMLEARKLSHFHWDLDPKEWQHGNVKRTIDYLEKNVGRMTTRQVLLMHDIKKATVGALPIFLDWLEAENARRKELRIRRIHIIQSYELAEERLPAGLLDWLSDIAPDRAAWSKAIASVLP